MFGAPHESDQERASFDVAAHGHQIAARIEDAEPARVRIHRNGGRGKATGRALLRVGNRDPVDQRGGRVGRHRADHQLPVIGEHAERNQPHGTPVEPFVEHPQKGPII
jgi:hypothetical protein